MLLYSNSIRRFIVSSLVQHCQTPSNLGFVLTQIILIQPHWQPEHCTWKTRKFVCGASVTWLVLNLYYLLCVCVWTCHDSFKYLFHHHSSQVPENLIQIWDGLHYLSDLPLTLFNHYWVLLHQHQLVVCEPLKPKNDSQWLHSNNSYYKCSNTFINCSHI